MAWTTVGLLALLYLGVPISGDLYSDILPIYAKRFNEIRNVMLPVSDSDFQEGLFHIGSMVIPVDGESELCRNHSNYLLESLLNNDLWALRMVDASTKLSSGMIDGRVMDLGSYDQCLYSAVPGDAFRGQLCVVETKGVLPEYVENFNAEHTMYPTVRLDAMFSLCVPSTCSFKDVIAHVNVVLEPINGTAILEETSCTTTEPDPFSVGDWAATTLIGLLFTMVIMGTIYDFISETGKCGFLTAFSLKRNIPKMLSTEVRPGSIRSLNGLRVLAFCWVVTGHRMLINISTPVERSRVIFERMPTLAWAPLQNGLLSVDVFFFMTGLLVTYGYLGYRDKGKKVNFIHFYLLRYLRMTPALALTVLITSTIGIRLGDGPLWKRVFGIYKNNCLSNWWSTLLYISNYASPTKICVPQTWYLAADFQMYAFSPLLLIPLHKKPKLGLTLTGLFLMLTTAAGLWNAYSLELRAGGATSLDRRTDKTMIEDYLKTHVRAATFIIGMAMGFLLFKLKEGHLSLKLSKPTLWAGWIISTFLIVFSIFFVNHFHQEGYIYNQWLEVTYQVLHRHLFILGISWIVLVCDLGYGGILDKFLSWKPFIPLARLTYSAYLVHLMLLFIFTLNSRIVMSMTLSSLWYQFFGDLSFTYLTGTVIYLLVENPLAVLVNLAVQGKRKPESSRV